MSLLSNFQDLVTTIKLSLAGKVDRTEGKGLSTNDYTTSDKSKLSLIESGAQVNVIEEIKTSSGSTLAPLNKVVTLPAYITNSVSDLTNYYTKSDLYTKSEVNTLIGDLHSVSILVVDERPSTGSSNVIYFVPADDTETNNIYDEYIYVSSGEGNTQSWEKIGSTAVDLTNYAQLSDLPFVINLSSMTETSATLDRTWAQIIEAYEAGRIIQVYDTSEQKMLPTGVSKSTVSSVSTYRLRFEYFFINQGVLYYVRALGAYNASTNTATWTNTSTAINDMSNYSTTTSTQSWVDSQGFAKTTDIPTVPTSDITANTTARHTHSNKTVLDKFSESGGAVLYDGSEIGGGGFYVGDTAPQDTDVLWIDTSDDSLDLVYGYGTNVGDIPIWNGHNWEAIPKWQMIYQPCEYVESSYSGASGPYIDTEFSPTNKTSIEAEIAFTDNSATSGQFMGMRYWTSSSDKRALFFGLRYSGGTKYLALFTMYPESTPAQIAYDSDFHTYKINPTSQQIDSATFNLDYSQMPSSPENKNIYLFATDAYFYNSGLDLARAKAKIKSFAIKEDGVLIRDFVPCYNIFTGDIGMFDKANSKFYGNNGSGTFTKGPDITPVSSLPTAIPNGTGGTY